MGWSPRCCTTGEISGDRLVSAWKRSTTRSTHLLLTFSRWRKPCWLDTLAVLFRYRCEIFPHLTTHRSGLTSIRVNEHCNFAMSPIFFSLPSFFFFFPHGNFHPPPWTIDFAIQCRAKVRNRLRRFDGVSNNVSVEFYRSGKLFNYDSVGGWRKIGVDVCKINVEREWFN